MRKIIYVLPGISIGGGVAVVCQHANRLRDRGYDVTIVHTDLKQSTQIAWFNCNVPVYRWDWKNDKFPLKDIDIAIATYFTTAKLILQHVEAKRKIYFVQSDERRFGLDAKHFLECQQSYHSDIEFMTEAKWIQRWLKEEFDKDAYYVPNGLDEKIFFQTEPMEEKKNKKRVLLEGPISIPFKGMLDAYSAVKDLECEIWIVSSAGKPEVDWQFERFFENVPMGEMNAIYSSCDILLKMSKVEGFFGPPLEAMACGCVPIVTNCTGYDEYIEDGENAIVVQIGDIASAKNAVEKLMLNDQLYQHMQRKGEETVQQWSWDNSIDLLEDVLKKSPVAIYYTQDKPKYYDYSETMHSCKNDILSKSIEVMAMQNFLIEQNQKTIKNYAMAVDVFEGQIRDRDRAIEQFKKEINLYKFEIFSIKNSKLWKVRAFYQKIKSLFQNIFCIICHRKWRFLTNERKK